MNLEKTTFSQVSSIVPIKTNAEVQQIPYKNSKTEIQQYGSGVALAMLGFLIIAWLVLNVLKKKYATGILANKYEKKLQVVERIKISSKSSLLLIQYQNRAFILSLSGESLTLISEVDSQPQ